MHETPFRLYFIERRLSRSFSKMVFDFLARVCRTAPTVPGRLAVALNRRRAAYRLEEIPALVRRDIGLTRAE